MTRFGRIGTAAILFSMMAAAPAMARHHVRYIVAEPAYPAESLFCATRDPGNPHSKYCDYLSWSKWRSRGGWDGSLDNACLHNPAFIPGECGFNRQGQPLFGAYP